MEGIEIGKAISEYGIAIVTGIFLVLVCWLVRYLIINILDMFKNELKSLHNDSLVNAKLNQKSISLQKQLSKNVMSLSEYLYSHFNGKCADGINCKKEGEKVKK